MYEGFRNRRAVEKRAVVINAKFYPTHVQIKYTLRIVKSDDSLSQSDQSHYYAFESEITRP